MLALSIGGGFRGVHERPIPRRRPGEALIRMRVAGICDTDLELDHGYMAFEGVPGHEFVGTVEEADDPHWPGKRVVGDINAGCGACPDCRARDGHHCLGRTVLGISARDGTLAEYFTLPERCLYEVPPAVSNDQAVFCEPLAAAAHVLDAADAAGRDAVVLGDGKLGLLVALVLGRAKARVTLVGHHPDHLALARAAGVRTLLETELDVLTERVGLVVEATGHPRGLERALGLVEPRGTLVLKTTLGRPFEVDLSRAVIDEVTLVGSRCGNLQVALDLLAQGAVDPTPLVAARYPLAEADRALEDAARPGVLKVLVDGP